MKQAKGHNMTNEQTIVLIANYRNQLQEVLIEVETLLPDEIKKRTTDNINQQLSWYPQTESLRNLIEQMGDDIGYLEG